jgi:hypothetical protein
MAFSNLVGIMRSALRQPEQAQTMAIKLDLTDTDTVLSGAPDDYCTSLLNAVAIRPGKLDDLLVLLDEKLRGTADHNLLQTWRGRGGHNKLAQAIADLRQSKKDLLTHSDPRTPQARVPLRIMRSAVSEIKEIVADKVVSDPLLFAADPEEVVAARSEVLAACRKTLTALDQLIVGIADAKLQSKQFRQAYGGQEAFVADRIMVRHLLDDRSTLDADSQDLLDAIEEHLKRVPAPAPQSNHPGPVPESAKL